MRLINSFLADDRGTETVEWAVMAGLIVAALITAVSAIGAWANGRFQALKTDLQAA